MKTKHKIMIAAAVIGVIGAIIAAIIQSFSNEKDQSASNDLVVVNNEKDQSASNDLVVVNNEIDQDTSNNPIIINNNNSQTGEYSDDNKQEATEENLDYEARIEELEQQNKELLEKISKIEKAYEDLKNNMSTQDDVNAEESGSENMPAINRDSVEFSDAPDILYDGNRYKKYIESDNVSFSVGGKTYYSGFEIYTLYGDSGFVYFNLENKYSKLIFDTGRNKDAKCDAVLLVTSKSTGMHEEYSLAGDIPSQHIEIDISGCSDLTMKLLNDDQRFGFGFFDIYYIP